MLDPLAANGLAPKIDLRGLVPLKGIVLWPAAEDAPDGWYRCDGNNGTADLTSSEPVGTHLIQRLV